MRKGLALLAVFALIGCTEHRTINDLNHTSKDAADVPTNATLVQVATGEKYYIWSTQAVENTGVSSVRANGGSKYSRAIPASVSGEGLFLCSSYSDVLGEVKNGNKVCRTLTHHFYVTAEDVEKYDAAKAKAKQDNIAAATAEAAYQASPSQVALREKIAAQNAQFQEEKVNADKAEYQARMKTKADTAITVLPNTRHH